MALSKLLIALLLGVAMLVIGIRYHHRVLRAVGSRLGHVIALVPFLSGAAWAQHLGHPPQQISSAADGGGVIQGKLHVEIVQPGFGFNVLPGSTRRIFAKVTGGKGDDLTWSVTGDAKLSATTGHWVDVTAPPTGSECTFEGADTPVVHSATQFKVSTQLHSNPEQRASITINVCHPRVQVNVVPFYTTLYSGQKADIQAFVWGAVNRNVNWSIASMPKGGDGALTDTTNQDTVFSASAAGRYTLVATSVADHSEKNTVTVFVTGNKMPYLVTPGKTMPVDCTVDPGMNGPIYEVGPSQKYKTIKSVPWATLAAGSTVRIHNEDASGRNASTYHEYFQVTTHAERTQPVRVCGVPDAAGNLPVVDANNSTGSPEVSSYSVGYTPVGIGSTGWAGTYKPDWDGPQDLIVEGLRIQNAKAAYNYSKPSGEKLAWLQGAACIRLFRSRDTVIRGIDADNCSNGFMSDFNANTGYSAVVDTLYEGNHLHHNGDEGAYGEHQLYIQGWNELVQFNLIDQYQAGAEGAELKSRGFPDVVRYNYFGDGAYRELDFVDNEDAGAYCTFEGYLAGGINSYRTIYPRDQYTADLLAAAVEAHHADYAYGNIFVNTQAAVPIHYSTDHGAGEADRIGTLWFFNNTFYERLCINCGNFRWLLFDTAGSGGNDFPEYEWPQIEVDNNIIWMDSPKKPIFFWNNRKTQFTYFGKNVVNAGWGNGNLNGGDGTGFAHDGSEYEFQGASNAADTTGISNLQTATTQPFNADSFAPIQPSVGVALPDNGPMLPVRFRFGPSAIPELRKQMLTIGAVD